jgi:hypothetical protein
LACNPILSQQTQRAGQHASLYGLLQNSGFVSGHRFSDAVRSKSGAP